MLAFVPPETRAGTHGTSWLNLRLRLCCQAEQFVEDADVAAEAVPPRWPPKTTTIAEAEGLTYELAIVPLTSVSLVTSMTLRVEADAIADRHRRSAMEAALAEYVAADKTLLEEADWSKVRGLEFREALQQRDELVKQLEFLAVEEEDLGEMVRLRVRVKRTGIQADVLLSTVRYAACRAYARSQDRTVSLETRAFSKAIAHPPHFHRLRMALSDQNLELLPDYEQRIAVLKELQFIDENQMVQLKGRVACEVSTNSPRPDLVHLRLILHALVCPDQLGQRARVDRADPRQRLCRLRARRGGRPSLRLCVPRKVRVGAASDPEARRGTWCSVWCREACQERC